MFKPIQTILFATNLSEDCRAAFDLAASMATRYQATLVLLHVIEKMPESIEGRLKGLMGERRWHEMLSNLEDNARQALIGKNTSNKLIREALEQFCADAGIDDASCGYHSREIVIADGDIVEEVMARSKEYKADLIVLGTRSGFLSDNRLGQTIKSIMRHSKIPVLMAPPHSA
jgi:nucleotide-binding universal stress UspA family protein